MTLPADVLYPDCTNCGAIGTIYTVLEKSVERQQTAGHFRCLSCEATFSAPADSEWFGVMCLDDPLLTAYIEVEIRGKTVDEYRRCRGMTFHSAREKYREARDEVAEIRSGQMRSGVSPADD